MEQQESSQPTASFSDLLMNVFASPSEAFEGIRTTPTRVSVWLIPLILMIAFGAGFSYVMFTNETLRGQLMEAQDKQMQKRVDSGAMTQEQAEQGRQQMERMGGMMMVFGIVGSVIILSVMFFGAALLLWLVGKFALKAEAGYGKYMEAYGLSSWIGVLGSVVLLLMVMGMESLYASPSLGLAVFSNYDPADTLHRVLSSINVFSVWQSVVLGIGLSKLSGKSACVGIGVALGLWILWVALSVSLGFAR